MPPCNFIEIALRHVCSRVNLVYILRTFFPRNTSGWLLPDFVTFPLIVLLKIVHVIKNVFFKTGFVINNKPPLKKGAVTHV